MAVIENYIHPRHEGAQNILVTYVAWNGMIIILQTCHSDFQNEKKSQTQRDTYHRTSLICEIVEKSKSQKQTVDSWEAVAEPRQGGCGLVLKGYQMSVKQGRSARNAWYHEDHIILQCIVYLKISFLHYFPEMLSCPRGGPQTPAHKSAMCKDSPGLPALQSSSPKYLDSRCVPPQLV